MTKRTGALFALAFTFLAQAVPAYAELIAVQSYSMVNGYGTPQLGDNDYYDAQYRVNGSAAVHPNASTSGAFLSGGTGALTNGVIPTQGYGMYGTYGASVGGQDLYSLGLGPFVGWKYTDPIIVFNLTAGTIGEIALYVNNSYSGLAGPPGDILVNGHLVSTTSLVSESNARLSIDFTSDLLDPNDPLRVQIQLFRGHWGGDSLTYPYRNDDLWMSESYNKQLSSWVLLSEVEFLTAVPEVSTWVMMLLGFACVGAFASHRRISRSDALPTAS